MTSLSEEEISQITNQQLTRLLSALIPAAQSQFQISLQAIAAQVPPETNVGQIGGSLVAHFLASFAISLASGAMADPEDSISQDAMILVNHAFEIALMNAPERIQPPNLN